MKKICYILILLLTSSNILCHVSSKSYFSVQPIFKPISPETISIARNQLRILPEDKHFSIDFTIFGGKSFGHKNLARYFLPFDKTCIVAGELGSRAVRAGKADVIANYFGVQTSEPFQAGKVVNFSDNTFESILTLKPKQTYSGFGLVFKHHAARHTGMGFWYSITLPFVHVKNNINLEEKVIRRGGSNGSDPIVPPGYVGNMTRALNQPSWKFGKIKNNLPSKSGLSDLYISLGYLSLKEELYNLESFAGLSVPTERAADAEFLFEPRVGNNNHYTIFAGASTGFNIWSNCSNSIYFQLDTMGTMYAQNTQTRSFDLKGKPWSRYMWVYLDNKSTVTSPGINVFTRPLKISQGTARDLNSAFVFKNDCGVQIEAGYHFYSRQSEQAELSHKWIPGPAIAAIDNDGRFTLGQISRNNATINVYQGILNDRVDGVEVYKEIQKSDLDLESACHPALVSHIIYVSFSGNWNELKYPVYFGVGGSYEFTSRNTALERWMVWSKVGVSF